MDALNLAPPYCGRLAWRGPDFRTWLPFLRSVAGRHACLVGRPRLRKYRRAAGRRDAPPSRFRSAAPRTRLQFRQHRPGLTYGTTRGPFAIWSGEKKVATVLWA